MKFQKWNRTYHLENPKGFDREVADRYIVQMFRLLEKEQKKGVWGSNAFPYGHISADSFEVEDGQIVSFSQGALEMEYCPAEEIGPATDMFAMGMIIYELIHGKRYGSEKDVFLALDYDTLREEKERNGKTSLLDETDFPKYFAEIGRLVKELTRFSQENRIQSLDELPNAEYQWQMVDVRTGEVLAKSAGILDFFDKEKVFPEQYERLGKQYKRSLDQQNRMQKISYSFIQKTYRISYQETSQQEISNQKVQEVQKQRTTQNIQTQKQTGVFSQNTEMADLGIVARKQNGTLIFFPLFQAQETQNDWKEFKFYLPGLEEPYVTLEFFWRQKGHNDCVEFEKQNQWFQKAGSAEITMYSVAGKDKDKEKHLKYTHFRLKCYLGKDRTLAGVGTIGITAYDRCVWAGSESLKVHLEAPVFT